MAMLAPLGLGEYCGSSVRRRQAGRFVVTENTFEPGLVIPPHEHLHAHFTVVLEGSFTEAYPHATFECPTGSALIVPPDQPHSDEIGPHGAKTLGIELMPKFLTRFAESSELFREPRVIVEPSLPRRIERLYCEFRSLEPLSLIAIESIALDMLVALARSGERPTAEPHWIELVMARIHADPCAEISLEELSDVAGVHEAHLARTFKRLYGCSVGEYVRWLRLEAARKMLAETVRSVAEIAVEVGFYDQPHLSRAFKTEYGCSPSEYRLRFRPA